MKQLVSVAFDMLGFEFNRSTTLRRFINEHSFDLVIDAGANQGLRNKKRETARDIALALGHANLAEQMK